MSLERDEIIAWLENDWYPTQQRARAHRRAYCGERNHGGVDLCPQCAAMGRTWHNHPRPLRYGRGLFQDKPTFPDCVDPETGSVREKHAEHYRCIVRRILLHDADYKDSELEKDMRYL